MALTGRSQSRFGGGGSSLQLGSGSAGSVSAAAADGGAEAAAAAAFGAGVLPGVSGEPFALFLTRPARWGAIFCCA